MIASSHPQGKPQKMIKKIHSSKKDTETNGSSGNHKAER